MLAIEIFCMVFPHQNEIPTPNKCKNPTILGAKNCTLLPKSVGIDGVRVVQGDKEDLSVFLLFCTIQHLILNISMKNIYIYAFLLRPLTSKVFKVENLVMQM